MASGNAGISSVGYSCVVDGHPTFYFQSLFLLATLVERAGVDPRHVHVHVMSSCDALVTETCEALGVNVTPVDAVTWTGACNKLTQLGNPELRRYDKVVLCDCDLAFDENVVEAMASVDIAAKIVDLPNPPLPVLSSVLSASGLRRQPAHVPTTFFRSGTTYQLSRNGQIQGSFGTLENNCNGGLYVVDKEWWPRLTAKWLEWGTWLTAHAERLSSWTAHVDQVSFALATWDLGVAVTPLDVIYNCPLHLEGSWPDQLTTAPKILHFHRCFDRDGQLVWAAGRGDRSGVIDRANRALGRLLANLESRRPSLHAKIISHRTRWLNRESPD